MAQPGRTSCKHLKQNKKIVVTDEVRILFHFNIYMCH